MATMGGASFITDNGDRVEGVVVMSLDANGFAQPADAHGAGPSAAVTVTNFPQIQVVSGQTGVGAPPVGPPLSVSGVDGSGNKQHIKLATDGTVQVAGTVAQAGAPWSVSWSGQSVAATQSGTWAVNVQGGNATAVKVDGSAVVQPVSLASLPSLASGNNLIGSVSVAGLPALPAGTNSIGAVTGSGTFTVAGQAPAGSPPVSPPLSVSGLDGSGNKQHLLTDTSGRLAVNVNGTVPVSGTFWPATQPVSGTVTVGGSISVSNLPATQTVGGTVAVSSLPALAAGSNVIGSVGISGTVPVSGTFWQATQPVSGTVAVSNPFALDATLTGGSARMKLTDGTTNVVVTSQGSLSVSGQTPAGSPPATPPIAVSGVDGSGNKQHLLTDTSGRQIVSDVSNATHTPAYYQVSVTATAATLAALIATSVPSWATMAFITPETGALRYRADGTAPTTSVGQPIAQGQAWPVQGGAALAQMQVISQSGSVTVSIEFRG